MLRGRWCWIDEGHRGNLSTSSVLYMEEGCLEMCRLMGFVSSEPETFLAAAGNNLPEFIELSSIHCDGWGISAIEYGANTTKLDRAPELARSSSEFADVIAQTNSDGALLHLRWATAGMPVSENNTHPFVHDGYTFIHNGAIYPKNDLDDFIAKELKEFIKGETDSERYFYFLLTEINKLGLIEGVKSALAIIKEIDFSSINAMLLSESHFITICEHDPARKPDWAVEGYYDLFYKVTNEDVVVASSGWNQEGWKNLPNHHILTVDRSSLAVIVLAI